MVELGSKGRNRRCRVMPQSFGDLVVVVFAETYAFLLPSVSSSLLPLSLGGGVGVVAIS